MYTNIDQNNSFYVCYSIHGNSCRVYYFIYGGIFQSNVCIESLDTRYHLKQLKTLKEKGEAGTYALIN